MGDVFDKSSSIKNEAFVPLFMKLYEMKNSGIEFTFILGNHDIYTVNNDSIVETFHPIGRVVKDVLVDGDFTFLSYTKKEENVPVSGRWLFTHLPIANFSFDNLFHATEKHAFKEELFENYSLVFSGHFHRHQSRKNIVYVGSPVQLNFGEEGTTKGFIVFDDETENWEFVCYDEAPIYMTINLYDFNKIDPSNKFIRVKVDKKIENYVKLKRYLFEKGALDIVPIFKSENNMNEEIKNIHENKTIKEMIRQYLLEYKKENIDNKKLISIFERIVEDAI